MTPSFAPLTSSCPHLLRDRKEEGEGLPLPSSCPVALCRKGGAVPPSAMLSRAVSGCVRPVVFKPSLVSEPFVQSECSLGAPRPPGSL